ncbi:MAG: hypothetical protein WCV72_03430 [Patescibacteria group bacterium]
MKKPKLIGTLLAVSTILLLLWIIVFSIGGTLFGIGSGADMLVLLPFWILSTFQLLVLSFSFYLSLKLLRGQDLPIKKNNTVAFGLIAIGVVYFIYNFANIIYNNTSGINPGGEIRPVLAFLWGMVFVSFGIALHKGTEK